MSKLSRYFLALFLLSLTACDGGLEEATYEVSNRTGSIPENTYTEAYFGEIEGNTYMVLRWSKGGYVIVGQSNPFTKSKTELVNDFEGVDNLANGGTSTKPVLIMEYDSTPGVLHTNFKQFWPEAGSFLNISKATNTELSGDLDLKLIGLDDNSPLPLAGTMKIKFNAKKSTDLDALFSGWFPYTKVQKLLKK